MGSDPNPPDLAWSEPVTAATSIPYPPNVDPDVGEHFARLTALKVGDDEGWFRYLAGDPKSGRHLVELPDRRREVFRDEVFWWVLGLGDFSGHGDLLLTPRGHGLDGQPLPAVEVPELLTLEQAAEALRLSRTGLNRRLDLRQLQVVFLTRGHLQRYLIAAEVRAELAAKARAKDGMPDAGLAAEAEWQRLQNLWPPPIRIQDLGDVTVPAGAAPLGVPEAIPEVQRQIFACNRASEAGLIRYLYVDADRDVYGMSVTVDGHTTQRVLARAAVLPWLQGVADRAGRPELVAYRPGLA